MSKVKLLNDARILHKAGEIVEVSPLEYDFLISLGQAVDIEGAKEVKEEPVEKPVKAPAEEPVKKPAPKKTVKKPVAKKK